jgi:hypothetical protein
MIQHRSNDHVVQSLTITGELCASDFPLNHHAEIVEFQSGKLSAPLVLSECGYPICQESNHICYRHRAVNFQPGGPCRC